MEIYILPSMIALMIKFWLLAHTWHVLLKSDKNLGLFFIALLFLNLCELFGFILFFDDMLNALNILLLYYVSLFFVITSFINLSAFLSGCKFLYKPILYYLVMGVFSALLFSSDLFVSGVESIGYSVTRIPGEYYWIIQLYIVCGLLLAMFMLIAGVFRQKNYFFSRRCLILIIGFLPTILSSFVIMILMNLGYKINATMLIAITVSFFLIFYNRMIVAGDKVAQFKLLRKVPFTEERRQFKASHALVIETLTQAHYQQPMQLKEKLQQLEEQIIELAVHTSDGNQTRAAEQLGISKSNLNRKLNSKA
ncbi:helix-turn-helix domain-containing protein [Motiliproteus sp. MSK22-1]|uniref:helix-turn-helix domain-containing protein n=1 Tax=Motiliproteus sp. MSK22-1 TaxID=1897630 RepID=UPI00097718E2|nr:helix-turn-helix domain-containing protein [Motiliproteus sp. MSK22-1]OMH30314.1 hypothetical protein BGP75_18175 [Motiliproteus sp. MSK22-1]